MEIVAIWIILALVVGAVADNRKLGFAGGFFIALLLSPLIGFIIAAFSDKKVKQDPILNPFNPLQTIGQGEYRPPVTQSVADEIKKLKDLYDNGTLSEAEYIKQRNRILD